MKQSVIRILSLFIITVLLAVLVVRYLLGSSEEKIQPGAPAPGAAKPVAADVVVVQPVSLSETLSATGTLLPDEQVTLQMEVAGRIQEIYFQEGSAVQAGQLLLQLDNADLQAQLDKVEVQQALALDRMKRQEELLARGAVSREDYDRAVTEWRSLLADSLLLEVRIEKTMMRAPFSGIIGLRRVSKGSFVTTGQEIASLVKTNPMKIEFSLPEKYTGRIQKGDDITFTIEGVMQPYTATIYAIEPQIEAATRTFRIRATTANSGQQLTPGAFASITLPLEEYEETLLVPAEAVIPELGAQKVFVVREGKAVPILIETGIRKAAGVQVISGLSPGDTVVVSGILQLRPGLPVAIRQIVETPAP